ncbi:MORN repeat-containing protein 1-like isoform X2 [Glandiceps talaboti]
MAAKVNRPSNYVGETKKQLRDGYGVYNYTNSFYRYEGEWKGGKKHGHGKLLMKDGSYYEGEFIHGEIAGHGSRYWAHNGNFYSGQFENGELNGHGVMKYANECKYEGEFEKNKREGRGVLTEPDGSIYEGSFHNNKRHGDGQQTYANGDRYIGDWINGLRQGSGEMHFADTSIYDGQWRNDMFNGEGTYIGVSGMSYEGLWINGRPAIEADRLVFISPPVLEFVQGTSFNVEVETRNAEDELVEDNGREIQIIAAFRHYTPSEGTPLFNLIEDIEEKPIPTPYGYDVVNYPLTEMANFKLDERPPSPAPTKSTTTVGDILLEPSPEEEEGEALGEEKPVEAAAENQDNKEPAKEDDTAPPAATQPANGEPTEQPAGEQDGQTVPPEEGSGQEASIGQIPQVDLPEIETPLPPPVNTHRSEDGKTNFQDVVVPSAPPGYRPFSIMDEEIELNASNTKIKTKRRTSRSSSSIEDDSDSIDDGSQDSDNVDASRLDTKENAKVEARLAKQRREKAYGDERFARPGEYVIMAQDVTNPPFLGRTLTPAYMLVKISSALEKKTTAKKTKSSTKRSKTNVADKTKE